MTRFISLPLVLSVAPRGAKSKDGISTPLGALALEALPFKACPELVEGEVWVGMVLSGGV